MRPRTRRSASPPTCAPSASGRPSLPSSRGTIRCHRNSKNQGGTNMAKITRTNPKTISKPFSNYAHVVTVEEAKKLVFCAGQVAADVDGTVLPPTSFEAQTKMVMKNLENALAAGGAKF